MNFVLFIVITYKIVFVCSNNTSNKSSIRTVTENEALTENEENLVTTMETRNARRADFNRDPFMYSHPLDLELRYCPRPAACQPLKYNTCMGIKLPYSSTTLDLINLSSQEVVQEKLQLYQYLRYIPKCWAVIQPFLCALYMPKCENGKAYLASKEMCRIISGPCKILHRSGIFSDFMMKCSDSNLFPPRCKNDIHEVKFNLTGFCMEPLVKTEHSDWFYKEIEYCGLQCKDVLYTENEQQQIHKLVGYCVLICISLNTFTIVTFIIDWKTAKKYPALAIFYINFCFLICYCGWMIQFLGSETREDIVCKKDGTLRKSEPSANENLSCVVVFVMVYYFFVAGMVWFVIFAYSWYMSSLQALGKIQDRVDKKRAYFHLVAWSLPLILTITTMALGEIDGDYVLGICFVGFVNPAARAGLLLAPLAVTMVVAGYIITRGLILLIKVKIDSRDIISEHSSRKIRSNIVRMGVFTLFIIVFCIITFIYHGYVFMNSHIWDKSLHEFILCKLTSLSTDHSHCRKEVRPSVAMLQLQLLAIFGAGGAVASWVWCAATLHAWTRYVRRKFHCEVEEPIKFQKHKIIAQAFEKRKKFNEGRKISIECQPHSDPVGLHFDLNSAASNELSTTWAANLPRLVNRRGAVPNEVATYSVSSNSEMSYSLQHISIESRRNSGESQLSVQIAELKATRKINARRRHNRVRRKHEIISGSRTSRRYSKTSTKRNSSGSLDSHLGTQLLNMFSNNASMKNMPNLSKRRSANAGLDDQNLNNFLSNTKKLIIPGDKNLRRSRSEEENVSVTYSESKFNVVVNNHSNNHLDLSDQLIMKSLRQGLHIKELQSNSDTNDENESKNHKSEKSSYYSSDSDVESSDNDASCPELKQLLQNSVNSSIVARGTEQIK
ncbi:protein smoothened [Agrilus planipennis]|uniref:Protein smoothened n=1 Tax=Agrilus planipennis TaxID=224129 RepID=A0A7F5R7B8_AGRPL|nr:protein smoothened [Agrilus planipennis]